MASVTYRQRRVARDPVTIELDDGTVLTFPGDLNAGRWFDFINDHADALDGLNPSTIPDHLRGEWFRVVMSDDGYEQCVAADVNVLELGTIATRLWTHYMALHAVAEAAGGGQGKAPAQGSGGSSTNGPPSSGTSPSTTGYTDPTT